MAHPWDIEERRPMPWYDDRDDRPLQQQDHDLIAGNLRRIKDLIYGNVEEPPAARRSGQGTSGRTPEH
jgi:hypothetical protein